MARVVLHHRDMTRFKILRLSTFATAAAAAVTVQLLTAGCTVESSAEDTSCPSGEATGPCSTEGQRCAYGVEYTCVGAKMRNEKVCSGGVWTLGAHCDGLPQPVSSNASECPDTYPREGDTCSDDGLGCEFESFNTGKRESFPVVCTGGAWAHGAGGPTLDDGGVACPANKPAPGDSCVSDGLECPYGEEVTCVGAKLQPTMRCTGGSWGLGAHCDGLTDGG